MLIWFESDSPEWVRERETHRCRMNIISFFCFESFFFAYFGLTLVSFNPKAKIVSSHFAFVSMCCARCFDHESVNSRQQWRSSWDSTLERMIILILNDCKYEFFRFYFYYFSSSPPFHVRQSHTYFWMLRCWWNVCVFQLGQVDINWMSHDLRSINIHRPKQCSRSTPNNGRLSCRHQVSWLAHSPFRMTWHQPKCTCSSRSDGIFVKGLRCHPENSKAYFRFSCTKCVSQLTWHVSFCSVRDPAQIWESAWMPWASAKLISILYVSLHSVGANKSKVTFCSGSLVSPPNDVLPQPLARALNVPVSKCSGKHAGRTYKLKTMDDSSRIRAISWYFEGGLNCGCLIDSTMFTMIGFASSESVFSTRSPSRAYFAFPLRRR